MNCTPTVLSFMTLIILKPNSRKAGYNKGVDSMSKINLAPRSSGISHNYDLFEFHQILSLEVDRSGKTKTGVTITCLKAGASQEGHSIIAIATSNSTVLEL